MRTSSSHTVVALLVFVAVTLGQDAVVAAGESGTLGLAQALMGAAFPELKTPERQVTICIETNFSMKWDAVGILDVSVSTADSGQQPGRSRRDREVLAGELRVNRSKAEVVQAAFRGPYVHTDEMITIEHALTAQGHWAVSDVEREVARLGGRFPPSRQKEFASGVSLDRFRTIGASRLLSITLGVPGVPSQATDVEGPEPFWTVQFRAKGDECLFLKFEPIAGRFVRLDRGKCSGNW